MCASERGWEREGESRVIMCRRGVVVSNANHHTLSCARCVSMCDSCELVFRCTCTCLRACICETGDDAFQDCGLGDSSHAEECEVRVNVCQVRVCVCIRMCLFACHWGAS